MKASKAPQQSLAASIALISRLLKRLQAMTLPRRISASLLTLLLIATVSFPMFHSGKVSALSTFTQNDWSGGIGTDPSSQYASSNNLSTVAGLTPDGPNIGNWCGTAHCDSNWTKRQGYSLNNSSSSATNATFSIKVEYQAGMQSDFDDIRFVNGAGDEEHAYYLKSKIDGQEAEFLVQYSSIVGTDLTPEFIYFGNSAVASQSSEQPLLLTDKFAQAGQAAGTEIAPTVDFSWPGGNSPVSGLQSDNWSARWNGQIDLPSDGMYYFGIISSNDSTLFIDNNQVLSANGQNYVYITLASGLHDFRFEYIRNGYGDGTTLNWLLPTQNPGSESPVTIPSNVFTTTDPDTQSTVTGLYGEYFDGVQFGNDLGSAWNPQSFPSSSYSVNGDTLTAFSSSGYTLYAIPQMPYESVSTLEFDLMAAPNTSCNNNNSGPQGYAISFNNENCNYNTGLAQYMTIGYMQGVNYDSNQLRNLHFEYNTWYRFKVVRYGDQNTADYYYSSDAGQTYTKVPGYTKANYGVNTAITFYAGGNETKFRHISAYSSVPGITVGPLGVVQTLNGQGGVLLSAPIDFGSHAYFGNLTYETSGSGSVAIRVRSNSTLDMQGAKPFDTCNPLASDSDISESSCVIKNQQFLQYQVELADDASPDITLSSVNIGYSNDTITPPTNALNILLKKSASSPSIPVDSWVREAPYISWTAAQDDPDGAGIAGYCMYIGGQADADPVSDAGIISGSSPVDSGGVCPYVISDTHFDLATAELGNLQNGQRYYIRIIALDGAGNVFNGAPLETSFRVDNQEPDGGILYNTPATVQNSKIFTTTWQIVPGLSEISDSDSGIAGVKYCVAIMDQNGEGVDGCDDGPNWYGAQHTSGDIHDTSDVFPVSDLSFTTVAADAARLDDTTTGGPGLNAVFMVVIDNAGNVGEMYSFAPYVLIAVDAPSAPQDLQASPANNSTNSFSFSWNLPSSYAGAANTLNYCWTVNEEIADDQSNCHWTGAGITQLAAGPYATQQGTNTLYVAAKDQPGNFNANSAASITFSANTTAPGAPSDMELSDVSTRATSAWKLASSWGAPSQAGEGVAAYRIYRSTDNTNFTQVGTTSPENLSFIDTSLNQQTYYYYVRACDSASNCGVASNVASMKPTGRFTEPANLTASGQPKVSDLGPKKATITWTTDRDSDSRVALGTKPGEYAPQEIGNSTQQPDHQVNLTNLQPGTTYYYIAKWTDSDGNTGQSSEKSFSTLPAPNVGEVATEKITVSGASISFATSGASQARLSYGASEAFGATKSINTSTGDSTYSFDLDNLTDGTKYYFRIDVVDADGNIYIKDIQSFTTRSRPKISNLQFQPVADAPSSTQKVTWDTNVPASSRVSYGPPNALPSDIVDSTLVTEHSLTLTGLNDDTVYALQAVSVDAAGISANSEVRSFKTALDTRPPKISNVTVESTVRGTGSEARGQIIISWTTDELSTSQVAYGAGQTGALTNRTGQENRLTTDHVVIISSLDVASAYHLQVFSADKSNNTSNSDIQTVVVGRASENVFTIIFNALESIFGKRE